jgi:hypothetical protein
MSLNMKAEQSHNLWVADWRVIITAFGWIAIVAGIARITLPGPLKKIGQTMLEKPFMTILPGIFMVLLGGYLAYQGYLA